MGKRTKTSRNLRKINESLIIIHQSSRGLTLVELIIVIMIIAILATIALMLMNPLSQIQKVKDSRRQNDFSQLYTALDTYYNDKGCYPTALSQLTGSPVYIKKIPTDPDASMGVNYNYIIDSVTNNCPQWFALVTRGYRSTNAAPCPLEQLSACLPTNYTSGGYNTCKISGKIDCSVISSITLPDLPVSPIPTATGVPTPTPTTIPLPTPVNCYPNYYAISTGNCNTLGADDGNQCNIHGGPLVCHQADGFNGCTGPICDQ